nr:MAG TPA: hypothetical protein [Caudoviricetes sp.]
MYLAWQPFFFSLHRSLCRLFYHFSRLPHGFDYL